MSPRVASYSPPPDDRSLRFLGPARGLSEPPPTPNPQGPINGPVNLRAELDLDITLRAEVAPGAGFFRVRAEV